MKIQLDPGAFLPVRAHENDGGVDLRALETKYVFPGEHAIFETGVHAAIPPGYVGLLTSKSGLMAKGITSRGTIDSGYTGSIKVVVPALIEPVELVATLEETERGADGFGSSGL